MLPADAFSRNWTRPDGRASRCDRNGCRNRHQKLKRDRKLQAYWASRGIDPHSCIYCGGPAEELEHVFPRALGGTDDLSNLAPTCAPCNHGIGGKHDLHPVTWLQAAHPDRLQAIIDLFPHIVENS
jgi:5-methylcytosine-specific restriction endonuclease McrA